MFCFRGSACLGTAKVYRKTAKVHRAIMNMLCNPETGYAMLEPLTVGVMDVVL